MPQNARKRALNCVNKAQSIDQYGRGFSFYLPGGRKALKSFNGCLVTLISLFVVCFYSTMQLMKLLEFGDPSIMVSTRDAYFDTDHEFTTDAGLQIAFAITAYDANREPIDQPEYGALKPYYKSWGIVDSNDVHFEPLAADYCTREQLGLVADADEVKTGDREGSRFFATHKNAISDFTYYSKKYRCVTDDKMRIQGDYNAARTRSFVLLFEKCDEPEGSPIKCKSDAEIKEWLQRKFILLMYN